MKDLPALSHISEIALKYHFRGVDILFYNYKKEYDTRRMTIVPIRISGDELYVKYISPSDKTTYDVDILADNRRRLVIDGIDFS